MPRRRVGSSAAVVALIAATAVLVGCSGSTALSAPVGVRMHVDTTYYDVEGSEPRVWRLAMAEAAPAAGITPPSVAYTRASTSWRYGSTHATPNGCELRQVEVMLDLHFVMPRLRAESALTPAAAAEWRRYMVSLWSHEQGHATRNVRAAGQLRDELQRLRPPTCRTIAEEAQFHATAVLARYEALNKAYDERTRNGARQGALLILDPSRRLFVDTTYRDTMP